MIKLEFTVESGQGGVIISLSNIDRYEGYTLPESVFSDAIQKGAREKCDALVKQMAKDNPDWVIDIFEFTGSDAEILGKGFEERIRGIQRRPPTNEEDGQDG